MPEQEINALKISMVKIETNLKNFEEKLSTHISDQKTTDKKVDDSFKEVITKIDKLSDTFQTRIGDKADQSKIMEEFGKLDQKYAPRMAWQVMVWGGGIAGAILIVQLIYLIGKSYLHLYQ